MQSRVKYVSDDAPYRVRIKADERVRRCEQSHAVRLFLINRAGLTSLVVAAVGAHAMRRLLFVTMRALGEADRLERVVRAALGRTRLGVSSFWIRHRQSLILSERAQAK